MKNFNVSQKSKKAGFTLIELLVVIAIIGILSSVVLASLNTARAKSRDARRIADLSQIQKALELFYDANRQYPQPSQGWNTWSGHCPDYGNNDNYIVGLASTYIPVLPKDPIYDSGYQCYLYRSDTGGQNYILLAHTTMETIVGGDPSAAGNPSHIQASDRACCVQPTIAVYTPAFKNY